MKENIMVLMSIIYHTAHDYLIQQFPEGNGRWFCDGEGAALAVPMPIHMDEEFKVLNELEDLETSKPTRMLKLHKVKCKKIPEFLNEKDSDPKRYIKKLQKGEVEEQLIVGFYTKKQLFYVFGKESSGEIQNLLIELWERWMENLVKFCQSVEAYQPKNVNKGKKKRFRKFYSKAKYGKRSFL